MGKTAQRRRLQCTKKAELCRACWRTHQAGYSWDRPQWGPCKVMSYFAKDSINWACAKAQFVLSYLELWKIFPILTHWTCSNHTPATSGVHPLSKRLASTSSLMQGKSYWKHIRPQLSHQFTFTCSTCKLTSGKNTTMSWSRWSSWQQMVFDTAGPGQLHPKLSVISLWSFYTLWPRLLRSGAIVTEALQSPRDHMPHSNYRSLPSPGIQVILLPLRHLRACSRIPTQLFDCTLI